jgi:ABC-2 type transport system permease protein
VKNSVVWHLILKDLRLQRIQIIVSLAAGAAALALFEAKRELPAVLGATWFFVALIVLGCMLPMSNIIGERKKQNLAFVMSLPVSSREYTMAKILSTFGMFLTPWALLAIGALWLIGTGFPHGIIPVAVVLMLLVLVGFCVIAGVAIVSESEAWSAGAMIVCNSSYGVAWYLVIRVPETAKQLGGSVAIWSPRLLTMAGAECAVVFFCLGLTFYMQSRKRDFI